MRVVAKTAGALGAIALVGSLSTATPAHASNYGVELNGTYRGQIVLSPDGSFVVIDGTFNNTGGTGKFAGARGRGVSAGTIDFATGEIILAVTGCL